MQCPSLLARALGLEGSQRGELPPPSRDGKGGAPGGPGGLRRGQTVCGLRSSLQDRSQDQVRSFATSLAQVRPSNASRVSSPRPSLCARTSLTASQRPRPARPRWCRWSQVRPAHRGWGPQSSPFPEGPQGRGGGGAGIPQPGWVVRHKGCVSLRAPPPRKATLQAPTRAWGSMDNCPGPAISLGGHRVSLEESGRAGSRAWRLGQPGRALGRGGAGSDTCPPPAEYPFNQSPMVTRSCASSCIATDPDSIGVAHPVYCCFRDLCNSMQVTRLGATLLGLP